MKHRCFSILLIAVLILGLVGCAESRNATPDSDFEYYVNNQYVWINKYVGTGKDVVIPTKIEGKPVTYINYDSFKNTDIESVVIPDTVIQIRDSAFNSCRSLKKVDFGSGVIRIDETAFSSCDALEEILLPPCLESIGHHAFSSCDSVKKITVPKTLTKWSTEPFSGNTSLEEIHFEEGLEVIGGYGAFYGARNLKTLTIPASVKSIGDKAFDCSELESVTFLGDAPQEMGASVFDRLIGKDKDVVVYYDKNAAGWDGNKMFNQYTLKPSK